MSSVGLAVGFGVGRPRWFAWSVPETAAHVMTTKVSIPVLLYGGHA